MEDIDLSAVNNMQEKRNEQFSKWIGKVEAELKRRGFSVELSLSQGQSPVFLMPLSAVVTLRKEGRPDWSTYVPQHIMDVLPNPEDAVENNILFQWAFHMSRISGENVQVPSPPDRSAESNPVGEYWPDISERYGVSAYRVRKGSENIQLGRTWKDESGKYVIQVGRRAFFQFFFWQKVE